jgi:hypothetical protein
LGKTYCKFIQRAFPGCDRLECVEIQPFLGSIVKRKRENFKIDQFLREVLELECGTNVVELLYMAVGVYIIQAMKKR